MLRVLSVSLSHSLTRALLVSVFSIPRIAILTYGRCCIHKPGVSSLEPIVGARTWCQSPPRWQGPRDTGDHRTGRSPRGAAEGFHRPPDLREARRTRTRGTARRVLCAIVVFVRCEVFRVNLAWGADHGG